MFALCSAITAIDVWLNLIDLRGQSTWTLCALALGIVVLIGAVLTVVYLWSFRHVIVLSSRQLWVGSAMGGSKRITFGSVAALTIEKDKKHQFWILRNASLPRQAVRVLIEAYPALRQQIEDFRYHVNSLELEQ